DQPAWLSVAIVQTKAGHAPDFEALAGDLMHAQQEAGMPASQIYEVILGNAGEYHIVTPVASIAATETSPPPMAPEAMAVWLSRVTQHIDSVRFFYSQIHAEHSIQTDAGGSAPFLLLQTVRTVAGMEDEYVEWIADFLMPALRGSDVAGHTLSSGVFGDSPQNFYHAIPVTGWAYLDQPHPLARSMGQRAFEQLMGRTEGLVESNSIVIARARNDLMP
ncbi:MAG: hypothetical protein PVH89_10355, partial [Gammaproteobacteria bacterium]